MIKNAFGSDQRGEGASRFHLAVAPDKLGIDRHKRAVLADNNEAFFPIFCGCHTPGWAHRLATHTAIDIRWKNRDVPLLIAFELWVQTSSNLT